MKKEDTKQEPQVPQNPPQEPAMSPAEPSTTPNEDLFMENLGKKYPDAAGNREAIFGEAMKGYDHDHEYYKKSKAEATRLSEILSQDEDLNNFFVEIFQRGPQGHPELALAHIKPLMQQYINGDITSDEYIAEVDRMKAEDAKREQFQAIAKEAWNEECKERGWDPEETLKKLEALINHECDTKEECRQQVKNMLRILEYDDAVAAAETRGRNAQIKEQQRNHPSGQGSLPRNGGTPVGGTAPSKTLLGQAADAAAKRRAEYES